MSARRAAGVREVLGGASELRAALWPLLSAAEVISFDVFGTLVLRRINPPDQVKRCAARLLADSAHGVRLRLRTDAVLSLRRRLEEQLCTRSSKAGGDHEYRFTQLAHELAAGLCGALVSAEETAALERELLRCEAAAEARMLVVHSGMPQLLADLKAAGKRVIAVSDMYLDGALFEQVLQQQGLRTLLDAVYVSSDHGLTKRSGRLFERVFELERVRAASVVHVGDDPQADCEQARALGASVILMRAPDQERQTDVSRALRWLAEHNVFWRGPHVEAQLPEPAEHDFYYRYGYRTLGPVYAAFTERLYEALRAAGTERAFFLAREGDLFLHLYRQACASEGATPAGPTTDYLHVSRKAVALAAAHNGLSERELRRLLPAMRRRGLAAIARALTLEPSVFAPVARELSLSSVEQPLADEREWVELLLQNATLQSIVRERAKHGRAMLKRYLLQHGFFGAGRKVALVDIGWRGSIHRALKEAYAHDADWPDVTAFYMSHIDNEHNLGAHEAQGLLYDKSRSHFSDNIHVFFDVVFENGARGLHATTLGYRERADGVVEPVLQDAESRDRVAELRSEPLAAKLRAGASDHVERFARVFAASGYSADDLLPYAQAVAHRAVFFPTREEVDRLLQITHLEDIAGESVVDFSEYALSGPLAVLQPKDTLEKFKKSKWKYGTVRTLGLPGVNHLLRGTHWLMLLRSAYASGSLARSPHAPTARLWERVLIEAAKRGGLSAIAGMRRRLP